MKKPDTNIHIIGAGLAGSEAAWQIAKRGLAVTIHEMRPQKMTPAHHSGDCAELVCSNSFRSDDADRNAVGLLHEEMRRADSLIMQCATDHRVPAGGALAVDREGFAKAVTAQLESHPLISFAHEEVTSLDPKDWPEGSEIIVATGPLTAEALAASIQQITGQDALAFFDAIAPIVHYDSIDFTKAWKQSRYDKGDGADYINCPLDEEEYHNFINALLQGDKTEFKEWEKDTPYFEGCLPIEVMASRGVETLRFGPMKPVGLTNPHTGKQPHAVVQLRQDNKLGTLYNIVGFQTKLKWGAQTEIFRMIPGLEKAVFARLGGIHRNSFLNSPTLLDERLCLKAQQNIRFAGQITGCEGYVESASVGLMAGIFAAAKLQQKDVPLPPQNTAMGALLHHITGGAEASTFQPMNINFGLFPPLAQKHKKSQRKELMVARARTEFGQWLAAQDLSIAAA